MTAVGAEGRAERLARRLPGWLGSIRFRLTALYSLFLFGLAAALLSGLYVAVAVRLDEKPLSRNLEVVRVQPLPGGGSVIERDTVRVDLPTFEESVNRRALQLLRSYSFSALGLLFVASLGVGWVVAGRVLAPLDRITAVARDISATDLSRRIALEGPDDELKNMADTFDDMLGRLDDAFEQQRRFIQEASHELRNPLAVIRTNLDVALADPDASPDDLRATAEVVNRSAARMGQLVDDLLTYAREGAPVRELSLLSLVDVVEDTVAEFAATAAARRLVLESQPGPADVVGDRVALRQTLANLLANAVRLAPAGTTVKVASGVDGPWAWMAVDDAGPGIPPGLHGRVFERFWRGDRGQPGSAFRSGLGLAIVRQIAVAHGGQAYVADNGRGGATFTVWLPRADPAAGPADRLSAPTREDGAGPARLPSPLSVTPRRHP